MKSPLCDTLYITEVLSEFEADTFFPLIDMSVYHQFEWVKTLNSNNFVEWNLSK